MDDKPARDSSNELDRLTNVLGSQSEIIGMLESRLHPVSNRSPKEPSPATDAGAPLSGLHIGVLVDTALGNNKRLNRLIDELAI